MSDNEYDVHLWLRIERGGENRRLPGVVRPLLCAVVPLRRVLAPRPRFGRRGRTRRLHPCLAARRRAADHRLGTRLSVPRRAQPALNRLRDDRFSYIPFEELGEVFASPESLQIETDEITQLVAEAVSQLPGRCRDIFLKSRSEQLSNAEIAAEMHISVKTVEAQMSKALRRLRSLLHKE